MLSTKISFHRATCLVDIHLSIPCLLGLEIGKCPCTLLYEIDGRVGTTPTLPSMSYKSVQGHFPISRPNKQGILKGNFETDPYAFCYFLKLLLGNLDFSSVEKIFHCPFHYLEASRYLGMKTIL